MKKIKLFCFPYAGGSALAFSKWKKDFKESVQIYPVELPGRGRLIGSPLCTSADSLVNSALQYIERDLDGEPFAMYGHSMGTILAYEVACRIRKRCGHGPVHMFFSGRYPPHLQVKSKDLHKLPAEDFIGEILKIGGTPQEIFENKELSELFIPVLRADYTAVETYDHSWENEVFDCDITVLSGKDDEITRNNLSEWSRYTKGVCRFYEFEGGHFFIHEQTREVLEVIKGALHSSFINNQK